jgi:hypothetical protein
MTFEKGPSEVNLMVFHKTKTMAASENTGVHIESIASIGISSSTSTSSQGRVSREFIKGRSAGSKC